MVNEITMDEFLSGKVAPPLQSPSTPDTSEITMDQFLSGKVTPPASQTGQPTQPSNKPFKDKDFGVYKKLIKDKSTTPEKLTSWLSTNGYGQSSNAKDVLDFVKDQPNAVILNNYTDNTPHPVPDGIPQPGSPTDWLPDFIQKPVERAGLALGMIDPKTYYGLGDYGANAVKPGAETIAKNPAVPGFGERVARSAEEAFSSAGGSVGSIFKRGASDVADDDAIRHYGSQQGWSGPQIDAAIEKARLSRGAALKEERLQQSIRNADEARREDGGKETWAGWLKRGSADLLGGALADGPLIAAAPEIKAAKAGAPLVGRAASYLSERLAPVAEGFAAKVLPSAAGQAAVQGATDVASQTSEIQSGIKDHYDPVQTVVHASLGGLLPVAGSAAKPLIGKAASGVSSALGKAGDVVSDASSALSSRFNTTVSKTYTRLANDAEALAKTYEANGDAAGAASARQSAAAYTARATEVTSADPTLPAGMKPRDVARATKQLAGIQLEANAFKGSPEPKPTDVFPTDASRAADAEAWGKTLGEPTPTATPVEPQHEPYVHDISPAVAPNTLEDDIKFLQSKGLNPSHFSSEEELQKAAGLIRGREPLEPTSYEGTVSTEMPSDPPALTKTEAGKQFPTAPAKQSHTQWGKSLEAQAAEWEAAREAGNTEPTPSPAARNATAEAPPQEGSLQSAQGAQPESAAQPDAPAPTDSIQAPQVPEEDLVARITAALKTAGKATEEQKALYSAARKEQAAKLADVQVSGSGKDALVNSKAVLKGELPKADYAGIEQKFSEADVHELYDRITNTPTLSQYGKISAYQGLESVLKGGIPQPKTLEHLSETFGTDFVKTIVSHRKRLAKSVGTFGEIWNLPKSVLSTMDLSAPLRQGIGLSHRGEYWRSFGSMFKMAVSPKTFEELRTSIKTHPNYGLAEEAGLGLTALGDFSKSEEAFASHLGEKIPVFKYLHRGSERAYSGFLNKLRFDTFNSLIDDATKLGHDVQGSPEVSKSLANYINIMTGRGGLGSAESAANALNMVFFSPKMISSRLQIMTAPAHALGGGGFIADLPAGMKAEAAKSYAAIFTAQATLLSLAALGGAKVTWNPLSSDFGKAVDGNVHLDPGAGLNQYVVAGARALMRQSTSSSGDTRELKRQGDTPLDNDIKFLMNKLSPSLSLLADWQRGKDPVGNEFSWSKGIVQRLLPLTPADVASVLKEEPNNKGLIYGLLAILGESVSVYNPKPSKAQVLDSFIQKNAPQSEAAPAPTSSPDSLSTAPAEISMDEFLKGKVTAPDPSTNPTTTTPENYEASQILSGLGLHLTDKGVRSYADQERYYETTKGVSKPGTSTHEFGKAIDVRPSSGVSPADIVSALQAKGFEGIRIITKKHGTGKHWHVQWDSSPES